MRLAILHPFQFRYARGIERFTWSLSQALVNHGSSVHLFTWRWPHPVTWGDAPAGMHIHQMPNFRYFRPWMAGLWYFSQLAFRKFDWVMLYFAGNGEAEAMRLLRSVRRQPYCVVFHYPREQVPHRYKEFERYSLARQANRLIGVSNYVARGVEAQFGMPCETITNGVDLDAFHSSPERHSQARQKLGLGPDSPMLITHAALEERKGVQWVIRAVPRVLHEFPDLQYFVLGEGVYRSALETEISRLGLQQSVHLIGTTNDVQTYLSAADIGCLLSDGEAFGISLAEDMAMELPIITSQHQPFDEIVHSEWGVRVDERDTAVVAGEIEALLWDNSRRRKMGQAGRDYALGHLSWDHVADCYLNLLTLG